eukprot:2165534-Rhodomonas_salina.1
MSRRFLMWTLLTLTLPMQHGETKKEAFCLIACEHHFPTSRVLANRMSDIPMMLLEMQLCFFCGMRGRTCSMTMSLDAPHVCSASAMSNGWSKFSIFSNRSSMFGSAAPSARSRKMSMALLFMSRPVAEVASVPDAAYHADRHKVAGTNE